MIIIDAGAPEVADQVSFLHMWYDRATNREQKETIADEIYELVKDRVKSMIAREAKGIRLDKDQLHSLSWRALMAGLEGSGIAAFRRDSAQYSDWQPAIQALANAATRVGKGPLPRIWLLLSEKTRSAVLKNPRYITANVQSTVIAELNGLLKRRDLYDPLAWAGVPLPDDAKALLDAGVKTMPLADLARLNAHLVAAVLPGIKIPSKAERNLIGYIAKAVIPRMKEQIWSESGLIFTGWQAEIWGMLKPFMEQLQSMERNGTLPAEMAGMTRAQRVFYLYRRGLEQFRPVKEWYERQVLRLQPQNPFRIDSPEALKAARALLSEHGVPSSQWPALPIRVFKPVSLTTIQRMLELVERGRGTVSPESTISPVYTRPERDDPDAMRLLEGGHQSAAYRYIVDKVFSAPGHEAERAIGLFLTQNPQPAGPQVEIFLASLPEDVAEDIESMGWNRAVYEVDRRVLDAVKDQKVRAELVRIMGQPQTVSRAIASIRRQVFIRTAECIRLAGRPAAGLARREPCGPFLLRTAVQVH